MTWNITIICPTCGTSVSCNDIGHDSIVDAIAQRTADLLRGCGAGTATARDVARANDRFDATAADLAARYDVSAPWVRANARALGGRRLGGGPKAPHRFNIALADECLAAMRPAEATESATQPTPRRRPRRRPSSGIELLPINGRDSTATHAPGPGAKAAARVESLPSEKRRGAAATAPGMATGGQS